MLTWIDGEDAETAIKSLSEMEQYALGVQAGKILRKIHTIPAPADTDEWSERYFAVIDERLDAYRAESEPFNGNGVILDYVDKNRGLLADRPQTFIHGDYHEGNFIVGIDRELYIIDLLDEGFSNYADPWYDFKTFGENKNVYFSTGFVRGYFGGEPPRAFWDVLTYYIVIAALTSIVWTKYNRPEELPEALRWNEANAIAIGEGRSAIMKWYMPNLCYNARKISADEVPKLGELFTAFDNEIFISERQTAIESGECDILRGCQTLHRNISN